ncbi:MAG: PH domain-containing protein [Streptosporangiaceae bacterium]|nr:PH domain-containing protein [Streptosporangiaceae bacterium]
MRFVPSTDTVPPSLNRFLLPYERHVISVREHPARLIPPSLAVLAGLAFAGWLTSSVTHGNSTALLVIWGAWGVLVLWAVTRVAEWWVHYFAVTSQRLMVASGLLVRKVNMIPLNKVTDVEFRRTQTGRLLGYGEFEVLAPGMGDKLRNIRFLPYPEQLYLEVCGLMFKEEVSD